MSNQAEHEVNEILDAKMSQQARLYVEAIRSFDLIVSEEATRAQSEFSNRGKKTRKISYAEWIGMNMAQFNSYEAIMRMYLSPSNRRFPQGDEIENYAYYSSGFVAAVDMGLTQGYVKQGQGLVKKWTKSEQENQELKTKLAQVEEKYGKLFEHANDLEIKLAEVEKAKEAQRQADIRESMQKGKGSNQSKVEGEDQ
jgi:hypothetical protein